MFLPSELATIARGCLWPEGRVHVPAPTEPTAEPVLGAWTRDTDAARTDGGNLVYGSCVPTGCCNAVIDAEARRGRLITLDSKVSLDAYSAVTGFKQDDPATDKGTDPLVMWAWWKKNPIAGWVLRDAIALDPQNENAMRRAVEKYPAVGVVFNLGVDQQNQRVLKPTGQAGGWGKHFVAFDTFVGALDIGTSWGQPFYVDRGFFERPDFTPAAWALDIVPVAA